MAAISIRANDTVRVTTGKDRDKEGRVLKVLVRDGRAIVEGVNKVKRHTKQNPAKGIKGGIVEREASIHISNLMLVCPDCAKATRVRRDRDSDGNRFRVCKKCKASVDRKAES